MIPGQEPEPPGIEDLSKLGQQVLAQLEGSEPFLFEREIKKDDTVAETLQHETEIEHEGLLIICAAFISSEVGPKGVRTFPAEPWVRVAYPPPDSPSEQFTVAMRGGRILVAHWDQNGNPVFPEDREGIPIDDFVSQNNRDKYRERWNAVRRVMEIMNRISQQDD